MAYAHKLASPQAIELSRFATRAPEGLDKETAQAETDRLREELADLQELLWGAARQSVLVVLQGMDAAGKDGTIEHVIGAVNPQGCQVQAFKAPTEEELRHDFLWRIHQRTPPRGVIGIFNRSHYEDVLIVRVHKLVPEKRWKARYGHINAFEEMLHDEGVTIRKFFLHISKDYQKERLQRRLDDPEKHWKFNPDDLKERARWNDYQEAYEEALSRCSTKHAPWFVIPAENRPFRNLLVARALVEALEGLNMKYPEPTFDAADVRIV